jgi:hypothetical protein
MADEPLNPDAFYGADGLRYADKSLNSCERDNYYNWFDEQISIYGQKVEYYVNTYSLTDHDAIYGENPTAQFSTPVEIVMMLELSEDSIMLSQFGLESDDDVTAYITISSFKAAFPTAEEPKSGDVFKLSEYGEGRPGERDGKLFEITQRIDQDNTTINPLLGHYAWQIKAKRVDYTFRQGLTAEGGSDQVHDSSTIGGLSSSETKKYTDTVDETSKSDVFDYTSFGDNDDVYGDYY